MGRETQETIDLGLEISLHRELVRYLGLEVSPHREQWRTTPRMPTAASRVANLRLNVVRALALLMLDCLGAAIRRPVL